MMYKVFDDIEIPEGSFIMSDGKHYFVRARHVGSLVTLEQLRGLCDVAEKYGDGRLRLAARQNIQIYNLDLDHVEAAKAALDAIDMPAMGRFSDICINPDSGLAIGESFDVAPYAQRLGEWVRNADAAKMLPGKFKMSLSSSEMDGGNGSYGDLSYYAFEKDGKRYFKVYAGGSLGAMAMLAVLVEEALPAEDFLVAAEAVAKTFYALFEGVDIGKKRMRFKIRALGEDAFKALYAEKRAEVVSEALRFTPAPTAEKARPWQAEAAISHPAIHSTRFEGIYSLSLHTFDGMMTVKQMRALIDAVAGLGHEVEIALDSMHGLWLRDLSGPEAEALLPQLEPVLGDQRRALMVSCRGKGVCRFGLAHTATLLHRLKTIESIDLPEIHISGCMNSCGRHQVAALGFWGKSAGEKTTEDVFEVVVGGRLQEGEAARMAVPVGKIHTKDAVAFVEKLVAQKQADAPDMPWSDYLLANKSMVEALLAE